jgi:uncharacterized protein (TIGR03000 family)
MYSIVLMAALTGSADVPAFGHRGGGCCGCCGNYSCGCCGNYGCGCGGGGGRRGGHRHGGGCGCCGYAYSCGCCGNNYCCGSSCGSGCCDSGYMEGGAAPSHAMPSGKEPEKIGKPKAPKKETRGPAAATIIVSLPADAKLIVDDTVTTSTSASRVLTTPELELGQDYHYNLKAEVVLDGKTVTMAKRVAVRAGEQTSVSLFPETSLAQR